MAEPTTEEQSLISEFRVRMKDALVTEEQNSSPYLLRWIRARDHDLDKAEQMLRSSLKWREELNVDKVLNVDLDPWFERNFPYWIDSVDKKGHPLMEMPLGVWDMRKVVTPEYEPYFETFINRFFERILQNVRESNSNRPKGSWPNTQWTIIVDWKNYSYAQLIHWKALQSTLKFAASYEAHYPEVLYKCYFVNCPSIFPLFMALLKKIIVPRTVEKIVCLGREEEWGPLLKEDIDEDQLGHLYGGKKIRMVGNEVYDYDFHNRGHA